MRGAVYPAGLVSPHATQGARDAPRSPGDGPATAGCSRRPGRRRPRRLGRQRPRRLGDDGPLERQRPRPLGGNARARSGAHGSGGSAITARLSGNALGRSVATPQRPRPVGRPWPRRFGDNGPLERQRPRPLGGNARARSSARSGAHGSGGSPDRTFLPKVRRTSRRFGLVRRGGAQADAGAAIRRSDRWADRESRTIRASPTRPWMPLTPPAGTAQPAQIA